VEDIEELARHAVDCGFRIHKAFGPGLLESFYEAVLAESLRKRGLSVQTQRPIDVAYEGAVLPGFRADILIEDKLLIEVKSVERLAPVHGKQVLTYLRLMEQPLGLLMNFGCATFREGVKRVVNDHHFASSRLRVNQNSAHGRPQSQMSEPN
jgi:iron complex transport system substrate-binding protein